MPLLTKRQYKQTTRPVRLYGHNQASVPLVQGLKATESGVSIGGRTFSQIRLDFSVPVNRADFQAARVWVKSYRTNPNFVEMGGGKVSPIYILLEPSSETLTIAVQSETVDGRTSEVERSPTVGVVNDGV